MSGRHLIQAIHLLISCSELKTQKEFLLSEQDLIASLTTYLQLYLIVHRL